ncbi:MAG: hypothetical protein U0547_04525 [Dehalococcoidia bacterium]
MSPQGGSSATSLLADVRAPVRRLLDEYLAARAEIDTIIGTLSATLAEPPRDPVTPAAALEPPEAAASAAGPLRIDVRGDLARIMDFQERLGLVADVSRVSVVGLDHGRATIIVELGEVDDPTVICMGCGKTLVAGGRRQSHGLCDACATAFKAQRRVPRHESVAPLEDDESATGGA